MNNLLARSIKSQLLSGRSIFSVICFLIVSWSSVATAEEWITEEVLKQLSEVRQEIKGLKEEVKALKAVVEKGNTGNDPGSGRNLDISTAPYIGNQDAEVAIVEFSDYQCPYCKRHFSQTLPQIDESYLKSNRVIYVMKQFPLSFHAQARGASIAALCVEQLKPGNYWQAHKAIFNGEIRLDKEDYQSLAASLEIDQSKFTSCLDSPAMSEQVDTDIREGNAIGVSGTPAFFIGKVIDGKVVNGQLLSGARPYASFASMIDQLLAEG